MANSSRKVKKAELERQEQTEREIIGICFIALALFLAAGIYTDMVGVIGNAAKNLTFGLFGIAGYAAPFILCRPGYTFYRYVKITCKQFNAVVDSWRGRMSPRYYTIPLPAAK